MNETSAQIRHIALLHDQLGYVEGSMHGVTSYFAYVIPELRKRGIDASVCVLSREHSSKSWLESLGIRCTFLNAGKYDPSVLFSIARYARREKPDVIHAAGFKSILFARALAASTGRGSVIHIHDCYSVPIWMKPFQRSLGRYTGAAIAVSGAARSIVPQFGVPPERTHVLHNGVPLQRFRAVSARQIDTTRRELALSPGAKIVLMIGQVRAQKGQWVLLEALDRVRRRFAEVTALFAGEGPDLPQLKERTKSLGLNAHVHWLGFRQDVPVLLHLATVVAIPSTIAEGFGFPVIEGYACGVPAVGSNIGGIPEVIADGQTGLLVPPADAESLADALCSILQDESLQRTLANGATEAADEFSVERHVDKLIRIYADAAAYNR